MKQLERSERGYRRCRYVTLLSLLLLCVFLLTACVQPIRTFSFETHPVNSVGAAFEHPAVGLVDHEVPLGAPVPWNGGFLWMTFTEGEDDNLVFLASDGSERRLPVHAFDFAASEDGVYYICGAPDERQIYFLPSEDAEPERIPTETGNPVRLWVEDGRLVWTEPFTDGADVSRVRYCAYDPETDRTAPLAETFVLGGQNMNPSVQSGYLTFLDIDSGKYVFRAVPVKGGEPLEVNRVGLSDVPVRWAFDGRFLVWKTNLSDKLHRFDRETGKESVLSEKVSDGEMRLLDERYAVFFTKDGLCVLELSSGEPMFRLGGDDLGEKTFQSAWIGVNGESGALAFALTDPDETNYIGALNWK